MSTATKRSRLTSSSAAPDTRPRLELEFGSFVPRVCEQAPDPSQDVELLFEHASSAIATHAAAGAFTAAAAQPQVYTELKGQLSQALDLDLGGWIGEVKQTRSPKRKSLVRMLEQLRDESAHSRGAFFDHLIGALFEPRTWQTVHENVGPRPNVCVQLFLPGSYAHATQAKPLEDIDLAVVYHASDRADEGIEDLTRTLTPAGPFPTPPVLLQARRNAQARSALLHEFGALTAAEVAELAGSEARNTSALAGRWRREGRVLAVEHHGTAYYPAFQFDPDGQPKPIVHEVLDYLNGPDTTAWQQALWFTSANGWLDGERPVDLLDDRPAAVVAAAREVTREPVG